MLAPDSTQNAPVNRVAICVFDTRQNLNNVIAQLSVSGLTAQDIALWASVEPTVEALSQQIYSVVYPTSAALPDGPTEMTEAEWYAPENSWMFPASRRWIRAELNNGRDVILVRYRLSGQSQAAQILLGAKGARRLEFHDLPGKAKAGA